MLPGLPSPTWSRSRLDSLLWQLFYSARRLPRIPVTAAAGRLDHEHVPRRHFGLVERAELGAPAVGPQHVVASGRARLAAGHAVRAHQAVSGKDRRGHRLEKAHPAHGAVTAAPATTTARAVADLEAFHAHGEAPFEHRGLGEARV